MPPSCASASFVLVLSLLVSAPFTFAQRDETGQPAPRFRAKTTTGEQLPSGDVCSIGIRRAGVAKFSHLMEALSQ